MTGAKLHAKEIQEGKHQAERDSWFNKVRPMTTLVKTRKEKHIEKEEQGDGFDSDSQSMEDKVCTDVNMVFQLPAKFGILESEVAQFMLGRGLSSRSQRNWESISNPCTLRGIWMVPRLTVC
jgi:hypothetical protein